MNADTVQSPVPRGLWLSSHLTFKHSKQGVQRKIAMVLEGLDRVLFFFFFFLEAVLSV